MTVSPDGKWLLVSSFLNNKILRFALASGVFVEELVGSSLLNGPNALLYAQDGHLYVTTEGSKYEHGNLTYPYKSQILRLSKDEKEWEVFADSADPYASPNHVFSPNFLGLAKSNTPSDGLLWVTDFSNGILAFDLKSKQMISRIETSFTGIPSSNGLGSLVFERGNAQNQYSILTPAFLPLEGNTGCILRSTFNATSDMPTTKPTFAVPLYSAPLKKPINIIKYSPIRPRKPT